MAFIAAAGRAKSLAGVIDDQALAWRVGSPHRRGQLWGPAAIVVTEYAALVAAWLLSSVFLPQQFQRHTLVPQLIVHGLPDWRQRLHG